MDMQGKHEIQDSLTNLPNKLLLMDRIKQEIARSKRNKSMFAVIFIDLNRMTLANQQHDDIILKKIAEQLTKVTRREDTIARLNSDDHVFIAVATGLYQIENAVFIAGKILNTINEHLKTMVSASLGISIYPQDGATVEKLLHNADLAMKRAKAFGGNQFQLFTPKLQKKCIVRLEKESSLRRALKRKEFFLEYQPQYDIEDNQLIGVEALIRWQHPEKGILLPMDFMPFAEETNLIVPLGEWIISTACHQNKAWQERGILAFPVAVKVATKQLMHPNFISMIKNILENSGLDSKYLQVEITEQIINNPEKILDTVKELKELGVFIVLNDFGSGQSSFKDLHNLPIDQIKINKSFVKNINANRSY